MRREVIVAGDIAEPALRVFTQVRPRRLVLAGGRTPRLLYERLSHIPYYWRDVDVFFGDERCVPPEHPESNFRMADEALLSKVDARVHRIRGEACDAEGYEADLRSFFGDGLVEFDLAFLGVGVEGHTASLFPGDEALDERDRLAVRVSRPDVDRVTMTLGALSAARVAVFLVSGLEKSGILQRVLAGEDLPASRVQAGRVIIVADSEAAAGRG